MARKKPKPPKSWFLSRRLDFIDCRLLLYGSIRRADLMRVFGISMPQASADLSLFRRLYPRAMRYDLSEKRYVAADGYRSQCGLSVAVVRALEVVWERGYC